MGTNVVRPRGLFRVLLTLLFLAMPAAALAQEGGIAGRVIDQKTGAGLSAVQVEVLGPAGEVVAGGFTTGAGTYRLTGVPAGTYSVEFTLPGWSIVTRENVMVTTGETTSLAVTLTARSFNLNPITVTASKRVEKALEAPAAVEVVTREDVMEQPTVTIADHVKGEAGVDVITTGLQSNYTVVRGFNNIFSGATLTLTDYRIARVPSLRANISFLQPTNNLDIDRVEVVLGPGSALYGPNAANGVIHYLTQSPIDNPGVAMAFSTGLRQQDAFTKTVVLPGVGERTLAQGASDRSVWQLEGRVAVKTDDDKFGVKLSGQYFAGTDYFYIDANEVQQQTIAQGCIAAGYDPTQSACFNFAGDLPGLVDPITGFPLPPSLADPDALAALKVRVDNVAGGRDYGLDRWALDLRADWRPTEDWDVILSGGRTTAVNSVDLTGIGAGQVQDWGYWYGQARATYKKWFGQFFLNKSANDETYLLRSGRPLVDRSELLVGQLQHTTDINDNHALIYGLDLLRTVPKSDGTINGRHENDDDITEFGGYVQYDGTFTEKWNLVLAARLDDHSRLENPVFSPRAALVFHPTKERQIRFAYNRAFSTPTTLNLFLDISAQAIPITGPFFYDGRAQGTTENGFTFNRSDGGVPDHMSPFAPLVGATPRTFLPTTTQQVWSEAVELIRANDPQAGTLLDLAGTPAPNQVPVVGATLNPETQTFENPILNLAAIQDVPALDPTIWQTFEVGYKGLLFGSNLLLGANLYYTDVSDFVSALKTFTPNIFLPEAAVQGYLRGQFAPLVGTIFPSEAVANATADALAEQIGQVPFGSIVPTTAGGTTAAPILFTYQNLGSFNYWGADASLTYVFNNMWELSGSIGWVEKDVFDAGTENVPLNAPRWKGAAQVRYRNSDLGFNAAARGRFIDGFPVASGVYVGETKQYTVFDVNLGYEIPGMRGLTAQLDVSNLLDYNYQTFPGTPQLGRFTMLRLLWQTGF